MKPSSFSAVSPLIADAWSNATAKRAWDLPGPILVIGASGFIGARLFYSLLARRQDVFAASQQPERAWRLRFAPETNLVKLDIRDPAQVKRAFSYLRPKTVFNLAAYGAYSWQSDAELIHETNYLGTHHLLAQSLENGVSAFVTSGTSSEYGLNCRAPKEGATLEPNSHYAASKAGAAMQVHHYGKILRLPCVNLRLYSIYGPWEDSERLVYKAVSSALKGFLPPFADPEISRDFVFVDDCTAAFIDACHTACRDRAGASVNVAGGVKKTLREVAGDLQKIFSVKESPTFGTMPNRAWDLKDWYGDPEFAAEALGWRATTTFADGLKLTADWIRNFEKESSYLAPLIPKRKVSAVIACYRDDRAIPVMHERLSRAFREAGVNYEIIFVNDGSPTNDEAAIEALAEVDPNVIGISHSRNFGSQSAFLSGLEVASGDAAVLLDGDLQDPPELIPKFIEKWGEGYDVVYGERVRRDAPWHMALFYKLFYRIFQAMAEIKIPTDAGDFSLIDRKVIDELLACPERDVFLRGLRAWVGFPQTGVAYHRPERMFGRTTNSFFKNIWWAKKGIFSFSSKPLHLIQALGVSLFVVCFALVAFYVCEYFLHPPSHAPGVTTIICLVLILGSLQIISISVLGDYISKIVEEVKGRPRFIRRKIVSGSTQYDSPSKIAGFIAGQNPTRDR